MLMDTRHISQSCSCKWWPQASHWGPVRPADPWPDSDLTSEPVPHLAHVNTAPGGASQGNGPSGRVFGGCVGVFWRK